MKKSEFCFIQHFCHFCSSAQGYSASIFLITQRTLGNSIGSRTDSFVKFQHYCY